MKKLLTWILLAAMLTGSLAACGEKSTTNEGTDTTADTAPAAETETARETTELEGRQAVSDDLPENDFGGRDFIVITCDNADIQKYIAVEELNGEGVNDAVYSRNLTVADRFNANVVCNFVQTYDSCGPMVEKAITAGDEDSFHLIQYHVVSNSGNAMKGLYLNWYDVPHVNFDKPWWSDSNEDDLTVNNRCYLAMGDFALTAVASTYCVFYDKDRLKDYPDIEDLYTVASEGRWTLDYQRKIAEAAYVDTNGDGTVDDDDYYGFYTDAQSNVNTYLWSCDNQIFTKNADGELEFTYYNEHLLDVYEKCYALLNETVGAGYKADHDSGIDKFAQYGTLTANGQIRHAITKLAEYDNEYGILPYPKYDEAQKEYKTMVDGGHEAMAIGKQMTDLDFIGTMVEVLCAESYKQVLPAYYDVCLKQRYASSPEDAEMIDLCVASRVFDFGYVYDNWKGVSFLFQELLGSKQHQDITSAYQKKEKAATKHYNDVLALFYTEE